MTNIVAFPNIGRNQRLDTLMRDPRLAGWYGEVSAKGEIEFRPEGSSQSAPVGVIRDDDSWELRSPGGDAVLAAGQNYAWTTQGFPKPEVAAAIQLRGARPPRGFKAAPAPKKCNWCESTERTQPVGMQAPGDKKPRQVWACPQHLADAFQAAREYREGAKL